MALAHTGFEDSEQLVELYWRTTWDFFSGSNGAKSGYITDLHETGCTLKTSEPIEFRRWIRMMIRDAKTNVTFTAVGRVVRCENSFEASIGSEVTLYRYRVEFTYPVDVARLRESAITDADDAELQADYPRLRRSVSLIASTGSRGPTSA